MMMTTLAGRKERTIMSKAKPIDFDLLVDMDTPTEDWVNEVGKSRNLRRAVLDIADLRREARKRGIPISEGAEGLQAGFWHYVLEPAAAKALHEGKTDIPTLSQIRTMALASLVRQRRDSAGDERENGMESRFAYDRAAAYRLTAGTGIDYGMIVAADCAYFVWREEVERTRHLRVAVETMERDIARIERNDSGIEVVDGPRLMKRLALILESEDNLRAIEADLINAEEFLSSQCLKILKVIAAEDPGILEEMAALMKDLGEPESAGSTRPCPTGAGLGKV